MNIYIVYGTEFHGCRELLGIYDSIERAEIRKKIVEQDNGFDKVIIKTVELNEDL